MNRSTDPSLALLSGTLQDIHTIIACPMFHNNFPGQRRFCWVFLGGFQRRNKKVEDGWFSLQYFLANIYNSIWKIHFYQRKTKRYLLKQIRDIHLSYLAGSIKVPIYVGTGFQKTKKNSTSRSVEGIKNNEHPPNQNEPRKKPWLVGFYKGLYYPVI